MSKLIDEIIDFSEQLQVDLIGTSDISTIDFPKKHHPTNYLPEAKSAITVGFHLNQGSILNLPESRNSYMLEFNTINQKLNTINYRISSFLEEKGELALGAPGTASIGDAKRLAADFSHRHIAVAVGLGKFGVNNLILTPDYGPRVRFTTIITTAKLSPVVSKAEKLCTECLKCVEACPANALDGWEDNYSPQKGWRIDKEKCYHHIFVKLAGKRCGLCIKACPFS